MERLGDVMQLFSKKNIRLWSMLGQRGTVCGVALPEIMEENTNCYALTADLGQTSGLNRVMEQFPERFVNVGIAEQNLIGVAAGLAFDGNVPVATTFATFLTMRCFEQIRHNLGYQKANVKLLGGAAGFAMGMFGNTHYAYEDIALMRQIPNMTVIAPADATEAYFAFYQAMKTDGPVYIRLSDGANSKIVYREAFDYKIGQGVCMKEGYEVVIIATGGMVNDALEAAELLLKYGIQAEVVNMHTIKPLDKATLEKYLGWRLIVTVEEHSMIGGLGSAVAEYYAAFSNKPKQIIIGVEDRFSMPGDQEYVKKINGLDDENIAERIRREILI